MGNKIYFFIADDLLFNRSLIKEVIDTFVTDNEINDFNICEFVTPQEEVSFFGLNGVSKQSCFLSEIKGNSKVVIFQDINAGGINFPVNEIIALPFIDYVFIFSANNIAMDRIKTSAKVSKFPKPVQVGALLAALEEKLIT